MNAKQWYQRISLPSSSSSLSHYPLPLTALSRKWCVQGKAAAVEQEEAEAEDMEGEEVSAASEEVEDVKTKLYFGNLPYSMDSSQLTLIIQEYATPELVEVIYDRETGRSRGFAFVTMSTVEDCEAVIDNLHGCEYIGRSLRVNFADKPKTRDEALYPETKHKLFIGNLAWTVTIESLMEAFQAHGNVVGARVLYDGETGRARGFGFVCFETRSEMEAALEAMNGVELEGRALRVSIAIGRQG